MANRPVFMVANDNQFCQKINVDFEYFSGFSEKQQRRCINSLHNSFKIIHPEKRVLEISSKSENELGVQLSAFNLFIKTKSGKEFSVESAFQGSKVFENGGPYIDLLSQTSRQAKKDMRLKNSGKLISFVYGGKTFPIEPKTYFYNWLYINALHLHLQLSTEILNYDAFTDIAFNPQKSINCQAEAAAIFVSLHKQGLLEKALIDKDTFLDVVYPNHTKSNNNSVQLNIFDN